MSYREFHATMSETVLKQEKQFVVEDIFKLLIKPLREHFTHDDDARDYIVFRLKRLMAVGLISCDEMKYWVN